MKKSQKNREETNKYLLDCMQLVTNTNLRNTRVIIMASGRFKSCFAEQVLRDRRGRRRWEVEAFCGSLLTTTDGSESEEVLSALNIIQI